ncbi:PAS domain-containing protein [Patulibacter minatonensis]|uniref:PAS domain-containing protein n=1 Tax=Patulibacter minatonensis TaxID=298163 RepID=UPI00047E4C65|nr:PAS domain-containing protein [Patulibacter minatonensis]
MDRLGAAALSSGVAVVRVTGVRDDLHLATLRRAIAAIRGIGAVDVRSEGEVPVLDVTTLRPVALASELRTVLGRQVVSCLAVDGQIELTVDPGHRGPHQGRPGVRARRDTDALHGPGALAGHIAYPGSGARGSAGPGTTGADTSGHGPPPPSSTRRSWAAYGARPPVADAAPGGDAPRPRPPGADPAESGLRQAIDAIASLSILTFDTDLRFVRTAGAMHDRYDHRGSELLGRRPDEIVGREHWKQLAPGYEGALRGRTTTLETPSPDGQRHYEATFRPLVDGDRIVGGTVTLRDITGERRDERRLEELRAVLASSFDRAPTGQALLSPDGEWMRTNEALRRLLGRSDESLLGTTLRETTHPDDRGREDQLLFGVRQGAQDGYDIEKRMLRGDGTELRVHARVSAIRTRETQIRGFIVHVDESGHWAAGGA